MIVLITNDDGVNAPGIAVLERIARTLSDDVWIIAPETDQSGVGHSVSMSEPFRLRKISDKHYAINGTPADCIIMGVRHVLDKAPDLILSGVNAGHNIAQYVTYSGTVGGALEGTIMGIRSIALSQHYNYEQDTRTVPWDVVEAHAPSLLKKLVLADMPKDTLLNLNFPSCDAANVKGVRVTEQGRIEHGLTMTERDDARGKQYFWLGFFPTDAEPNPNSDFSAINDGYISVTPLKLDLTARDAAQSLEELLSGS